MELLDCLTSIYFWLGVATPIIIWFLTVSLANFWLKYHNSWGGHE